MRRCSTGLLGAVRAGAQRRARGARRGGGGQDGAAGVRRRRGAGLPGRARRRRRVGDGARVRRAASAVRADARARDRRLPVPQRDALEAAFGLSAGARAGSVPRRAGRAEPAGRGGRGAAAALRRRRRPVAGPGVGAGARVRGPPLLAEAVALVFAVREPARSTTSRRCRSSCSRACADGDARALLDSASRAAGRAGPRPDHRRDARQPAGAAGAAARAERRRSWPAASGCPARSALAGPIEESFLRRLEALPPTPRRLLLLAAAEPVGDPRCCGARPSGSAIGRRRGGGAAEAPDCASSARACAFRHPLVRSAVYRAASPQDRRAVHRALAEVTDADARSRPPRVASRCGGRGPDEEVAAELERSAGRAQARGGLAAAAAFLRRAAALSPDPAARGAPLAAAQAKHPGRRARCGAGAAGDRGAGPLDEHQQAARDLLRAQIASPPSRGSDAPRCCCDAARRLEPLDIPLARETYLDALCAQRSSAAASPARAAHARRRARRRSARSAPRAAAAGRSAAGRLTTSSRWLPGRAAPTLRRGAATPSLDEELAGRRAPRWGWLREHGAIDGVGRTSVRTRSPRASPARTRRGRAGGPSAHAVNSSPGVRAAQRASARPPLPRSRSSTRRRRRRTAVHRALGRWPWPRIAGREAEFVALLDAATADASAGAGDRRWSRVSGRGPCCYNGLGRYQRGAGRGAGSLPMIAELQLRLGAARADRGRGAQRRPDARPSLCGAAEAGAGRRAPTGRSASRPAHARC